VDYDNFEDVRLRQGEHPQQCAGLMAMLVRDPQYIPTQIMQVAVRLKALDLSVLDPDREAFDTVEDAINHHSGVT